MDVNYKKKNRHLFLFKNIFIFLTIEKGLRQLQILETGQKCEFVHSGLVVNQEPVWTQTVLFC